ncbi:alpha/beta fold hydrolase [Nocardioides ungokensis]
MSSTPLGERHAFAAPDGTRLGYRVVGSGEPVICLPGGPMQDSAYLGDLGGLSGRRRLVLLDLRGTGRSAEPQDPTSWRCDRLVDDVEALRRHLGVDRLDLLAHSGGANLAVLYAARHPERLRQLLLVAPGLAAAGVDVPGSTRRAVARLRARETWFPAAFSALERVTSGAGADDDWAAIAPFFYGRWDAVARAHHAAGEHQRNDRAAAVFGSAGAFDPEATRVALAGLEGTATLVLAGEVDVNTPPSGAAELAACFPRGELVVQPGAGHFPWLDAPADFTAVTGAFLARTGSPAPT